MISESIHISDIFAASKINQPVLSASKTAGSFAAVFRNSMKERSLEGGNPIGADAPLALTLQRIRSVSWLRKPRINIVLCAVPVSRRTAPALSALCLSLYPAIPVPVARGFHRLTV